MSWNANIIEEFRKNEGRVGGGFTGATLLLLQQDGPLDGHGAGEPVGLPAG